MARTKGSKNKATLIREMREQGCKEATLDLLDYATLCDWHALVMEGKSVPRPASVPKPAVVLQQERIRISPDIAKSLYASTEAKLKHMAAWYGFEDPIPDRITDHLVKLFYAEDLEQAGVIAKTTVSKMFMFMLSEWSKRNVPGPRTAENIEKQVRQCESWVKRFEKEGKAEQAAKQRARLAEIQSIPVATEEPDWFR